MRRRRQLSRECEFLIRSYVFARCLTRPPDNLGMPLTLTPQSRNRFAPMRNTAFYGVTNIADASGISKRRGYAVGSVARTDHRARGLRDQAVLRSEEAPTLMALGGFEQLTLNPSRAEGPRRRGLSVTSRKIRRWPAVNGISCAPRAACFTANPRASARIDFISLSGARIGELEGFAKI